MERKIKKLPLSTIRRKLKGAGKPKACVEQAAFRKSVLRAVEDYLKEMAPSEFAQEVRRAHRSGDTSRIGKYLPPEMHQPFRPSGILTAKLPRLPSNMGKKVKMPEAKVLRARMRLVNAVSLKSTRRGKRVVLKVELAGQVRKGFPGRQPEIILTSRLASIWVRHGGQVAMGWSASHSPFEVFVEDVLTAIGIDDKCSARSLVRKHVASRPNPTSTRIVCQH
jgi:hypothetical protein